MICQIQEKPEGSSVNIQQPVTISWEDPAVPDQDTGWNFTYKPDPILDAIHPNVTVPRLEKNHVNY